MTNIIPLPRGPVVPPPERRPLLSVGQAVSLFMGLTTAVALLWALLAAMLVQG